MHDVGNHMMIHQAVNNLPVCELTKKGASRLANPLLLFGAEAGI
jgi:hypothetical protein